MFVLPMRKGSCSEGAAKAQRRHCKAVPADGSARQQQHHYSNRFLYPLNILLVVAARESNKITLAHGLRSTWEQSTAVTNPSKA